MPIAIAGAGYVGLTTAACLCELGHDVTLVEINPARLGMLQRGDCPIYEPGLEALLHRHLGGALRVTDSLSEAVSQSSLLFACVGTPPKNSGAPDLTALRRLLLSLRKARPAAAPLHVVLKSTVPPGTNRRAQQILGERFTVVSNPEFLREGSAIHDFFHPDRIVIGAESPAAAEPVARLYEKIDAPVITTGWEEAELIKYASNAFLAVKLSFANEMAALAERLGADGLAVLDGVGLDQRIGRHFLKPGPGYGGSCLPKDLAALRWTARRMRVRLDVLPAAQRANQRQARRVVAKLGDVAGKRIAVWGLAFKAGTDDVRESASLTVIPALLAQGAEVVAHDPQAAANFAAAMGSVGAAGLRLEADWREGLPGAAGLRLEADWREGLPGVARLRLAADQWEALSGADALLILTEWPQYAVSPHEIRAAMAGSLVVDARNLLDPAEAEAAGLQYRGVGRGARAG